MTPKRCLYWYKSGHQSPLLTPHNPPYRVPRVGSRFWTCLDNADPGPCHKVVTNTPKASVNPRYPDIGFGGRFWTFQIRTSTKRGSKMVVFGPKVGKTDPPKNGDIRKSGKNPKCGFLGCETKKQETRKSGKSENTFFGMLPKNGILRKMAISGNYRFLHTKRYTK